MSINVTERIEDLALKAQELEHRDISHDELGEANGFHEANNLKDMCAAYATKILKDTEEYMDLINKMFITENLQHIENTINQLNVICNNIDKLVHNGIHVPDYPQQRNTLFEQIEKRYANLRKTLIPFEHELSIGKIRAEISTSDYVNAAKNEIENLKEDVKKSNIESAKILHNLQDKVMTQSVDESISGFNHLKKNHRMQERTWFAIFVISAIITIIAFTYAINTEINVKDYIASLITLAKRIMIITIPAVFMKISLKKFNLERNLRIIYDHRESVLEQYKNFESAIGDDANAKNEFRLELAKYIFSDPQTGYNDRAPVGADLNINPIINMADKISKSATGAYAISK